MLEVARPPVGNPHWVVAPEQHCLPSMFLFLQLSPKRNDQNPQGGSVLLGLAAKPVCAAHHRVGRNWGPGGGLGLGCHIALEQCVSEWCRKGLSCSEQRLWPKNCQLGLWGAACRCSQGAALPWASHRLSAAPGGITLITGVWLLRTLATAYLQSMNKCMYVCLFT